MTLHLLQDSYLTVAPLLVTNSQQASHGHSTKSNENVTKCIERTALQITPTNSNLFIHVGKIEFIYKWFDPKMFLNALRNNHSNVKIVIWCASHFSYLAHRRFIGIYTVLSEKHNLWDAFLTTSFVISAGKYVESYMMLFLWSINDPFLLTEKSLVTKRWILYDNRKPSSQWFDYDVTPLNISQIQSCISKILFISGRPQFMLSNTAFWKPRRLQ